MSKRKYKLEELPVYEIMIDDEDETGIRYLSIVQDPAIETKGMFFNEDKFKEFRFYATKDEQKIVGPALIPYKKIYRADEDGEYFVMFTPETIQKMVRKFNGSGSNRRLNFNHSDQMVKAYIEQNWIIESDTYDKSKVYGYELPKGTWFVEVKIEDSEFWNEFVKEDGFYSFSIEGIMGQRLVSMSSHMDFYIDSLSDNEVMDLYQEFVIEPKSGESQDEFIGRCIGIEIDNGYESDQAAAICYSKWNEMGSDKKKAEELADSYNDYPKAATENAKIALRWAEENGWGDCGTPVGKARANQLAKGESISRETIARMAAFERHRQNSQKELGDGCGRLMWLAWGGDEGVEWAQRKLKQIDNQEFENTLIICKECGHQWNLEDGGDDVYICHKCYFDNE